MITPTQLLSYELGGCHGINPDLGCLTFSGNVAVNAGATAKMIDLVADRMIAEKKIRADRAKELVEEMSKVKQAG